jgi:hypothetical protein
VAKDITGSSLNRAGGSKCDGETSGGRAKEVVVTEPRE